MCHYKVGFPSGSTTGDSIAIYVNWKYTSNQLSIYCNSALTATPAMTWTYAAADYNYYCNYPYEVYMNYYSMGNNSGDFEVTYTYIPYVEPSSLIIEDNNDTLVANDTASTNSSSSNSTSNSSSSSNSTSEDGGIDKTNLFIGLAGAGTVIFIVLFIAMICWICYCKRKWPEW